MTETVVNIIPSKLAEDAQTTQYISPVSVTTANKTVIDKFTVSNISAARVQFSVNLVTLGDSPGNDNLTLPSHWIYPGEVYKCPELVGQSLEAGDYISTLAGTASALSIRSSGREIAI